MKAELLKESLLVLIQCLDVAQGDTLASVFLMSLGFLFFFSPKVRLWGWGLYKLPSQEMALPPTLVNLDNFKMEACQMIEGMMRQDLSLSLSLFSNPKDPIQSSGGGCQDHKQ